jgi:hypothetical protein
MGYAPQVILWRFMLYEIFTETSGTRHHDLFRFTPSAPALCAEIVGLEGVGQAIPMKKANFRMHGRKRPGSKAMGLAAVGTRALMHGRFDPSARQCTNPSTH